jgi:hypothetical protein
MSAGIRPQQVKGAAIYDLREQQASWTKVGSCAAPQQRQHLTVISCTLPAKVPLSRISFEVPTDKVNFRRGVSVEGQNVGRSENQSGFQVGGGDISRVRVNRGGTLVTAENLFINISGSYSQIRINVDNGDNPALPLNAVQALALERRIYFDPHGKSTLRLYYGDPELSSPIYDYARFFHLDPYPAPAELGPGTHNQQYAGRPDERPWSERHTAILWSAMIAAVLVLAVLALRGLRADSAYPK